MEGLLRHLDKLVVVALGAVNLRREENAGRLRREARLVTLMETDVSRRGIISDLADGRDDVVGRLIPALIPIELLSQPALERRIVQECQLWAGSAVANYVAPVVGPILSEFLGVK